jgi:hypothetical protein
MTRKRWMAALLCLLMVVAIPAPLLADPADPVTESGTATETVADPAGETETTEPEISSFRKSRMPNGKWYTMNSRIGKKK